MMHEVEAQIRPELRQGETLLWSGKSKRGFMFHPRSILLIIMILFLFALVGGLILINNTLHLVIVLEHLTSGESAGALFTYLVSGFFVLLGLVATWGFVFYPLERRKTAYVLTDREAIIVSGLLKQKIKSFELDAINFTALTEPSKGKATVVFGQVDPDQYGASDPAQQQAEINAWRRFGYKFVLFEVGDGSPRKRPLLGRFEYIAEAKKVYELLREKVTTSPSKSVDLKRQGAVVFLIDVSNSMHGEKLDQAKQGLLGALRMTDSNLVGLLSFNERICNTIPVAPLARNRRLLFETVSQMEAIGNTALYDAIRAGIEMTDSAAKTEEDICTVVVLTDGQANQGQVRLDSIVKMTTREGIAIREYSGFNNDAKDIEGRQVDSKDIKGSGLVLPTKHRVQIFFIGIGGDADMEIGRILAEATGGESENGVRFKGGTLVKRVRRIREMDVARVLEEFKYF